jgi:hypothetical protein
VLWITFSAKPKYLLKRLNINSPPIPPFEVGKREEA